jgi:hypothetical protein
MLEIQTEHLDAQKVGRMGELVVELALLAQGWLVGNFNATTGNSAGWDLYAVKGARNIKLRVKAKRPGVDAFQWSAKKDGSVFVNADVNDACDYVAAVDFYHSGEFDIYLVPTHIVERTLQADHSAWVQGTKPNGDARKDGAKRNIILNERNDGTIGHGYKLKWAVYRNAWHILDKLEPQ